MIKGTNIKDKLVEQVAAELQHPEEWVDKVITHQFKTAAEAMKTNSEVEISGFGKFLQSQPKIKRRVADKERILKNVENKIPFLTGKELYSWQNKRDSIAQELQFYYQRIKQ